MTTDGSELSHSKLLLFVEFNFTWATFLPHRSFQGDVISIPGQQMVHWWQLVELSGMSVLALPRSHSMQGLSQHDDTRLSSIIALSPGQVSVTKANNYDPTDIFILLKTSLSQQHYLVIPQYCTAYFATCNNADKFYRNSENYTDWMTSGKCALRHDLYHMNIGILTTARNSGQGESKLHLPNSNKFNQPINYCWPNRRPNFRRKSICLSYKVILSIEEIGLQIAAIFTSARKCV